MSSPALLQAFGVTKTFELGGGLTRRATRVHAVDGVSLDVRRGETLALVGESGCGKSTLGRCLVRLYDVTSGRIVFDGHEIGSKSVTALRPLRRSMQMIFQDPQSSLNPRRRAGDLVAEPLRLHEGLSGSLLNQRVAQIFDLVGLGEHQADRFPHEFSGGQRQRIGIARALAMEPRVIVADEPVSALDVSVQAQVVNLMADLRERLGLAYLFIAHDLGVVRQVSDRVAIMYLGSIVETGGAEAVFERPAHPYTEALISAIPVPDPGRARSRIVLQGEIPSPAAMPAGCKFVTRCPIAQPRCRAERPALLPLPDGRLAACHYPFGLAREAA